MVNDFLFELGCEELPSAAVFPLAEALAVSMVEALEKAQITYSEVKTFATPRRLALLITDLQDEQPGQRFIRRGPAVQAAYNAEGQPTPALTGFAKSCGVSVSELSVNKTDKGEWMVYESQTEAVKTSECLPSMVQQALTTLPIKKPMRWGDGEISFARPVHWAVMLLGNRLLPCNILGVETGCHTYGHRFHAPKPIKIEQPQQYESLLEAAYVVANFTKRRDIIVKQIEKVAKDYNARAIMPMALVDEVTSIVEWPTALVANFERDFLAVPSEALIASMQAHQKCFALEDHQGNLLPHFITIANLQSLQPLQVVAGNEKVMRARLSDATFFFEHDKKQALSHRIPMTARVVFQNRLGTLLDKSSRLQSLMQRFSTAFGLDCLQARRAAELCKCDLLTGMVGEFPELQGLMGYYYALHDGETLDIAIALKEQYLPRFAGDALPGSPIGTVLSLADRLDTLVGIFAIDEKPTGDKDPFKLRRHALAVVRLLVSHSGAIQLSHLLAETIAAYGEKLPQASAVTGELRSFILDRLPAHYQAQGIAFDIVMAARACQDDCLYDLDKRVKALAQFITLADALALAAACKRVNNLLQNEQMRSASYTVDENLLLEKAEKALFARVLSTEDALLPLFAASDYVAVLTQLASLRAPIDAFFEEVMVMVEDPAIKINRLSLLSRLQTLLQGAADISLLH